MAKAAFEEFSKVKLDALVKSASGTIALDYARKHLKLRKTIGAFVEQMQSDGAWDLVKDITFKELLTNLLAPAEPRQKGAAKKATKKRGKRLSKKEKAALMESIPDFLAKNPWSKGKDIAAAVGLPTTKLAGPLRELVASGAIKKQGKKAGTTYSAGASGSGAKPKAKKGKAKKKAAKKKAKKKAKK